MGRSQETFNKKEVRNKKIKKKKDKLAKREARKETGTAGGDDMIAYVDEYGNLVDTPPDPTKKKVIDEESIEISVPKREDVEYDPIRKGIVSFYNDSKGYGFIKDSETQESVFVHVNNIDEDIKENNKVTFEVERSPKGLSAVKVKIDRS